MFLVEVVGFWGLWIVGFGGVILGYSGSSCGCVGVLRGIGGFVWWLW